MNKICSDLPHQVLGCGDVVGPAFWVSSTSGFHCLIATKPVSSETSKPERRSNGDHSSIWDSWSMAFSGYPRGPRVLMRLRARGTQSPNLTAETRSRTRVSREPDGTAREDPQDGADSIRDTQAVCGFRCWASKHTPFFQTISTIVAIFRAKVSRAISGLMPLANKAA